MTLRRLGVLQWIGLLTGAVTWASAHVLGIGITQAECNVAGATFGIANHLWEGTLMGVAAGLVACAEICSIVVFVRTRGAEFGDGPPEEGWAGERVPTRLHFFAAAAMLANLVLLMIILLDGSANLFDIACRQS